MGADGDEDDGDVVGGSLGADDARRDAGGSLAGDARPDADDEVGSEKACDPSAEESRK